MAPRAIERLIYKQNGQTKENIDEDMIDYITKDMEDDEQKVHYRETMTPE